jgi:hypothetical protein
MNDWSPLAVDPRRCKKLGLKNELHKYKYAPDKAVQGAPNRKRELRKARWEERRGQLRLSLTNTYHEWPVLAVPRGPRRQLAAPRQPTGGDAVQHSTSDSKFLLRHHCVRSMMPICANHSCSFGQRALRQRRCFR